MSSLNLSNLRNDGKVYVALDSRHLLFILNTNFDLSGFVREALDGEIEYYEWNTTNKREARELEAVRKERRDVNDELHKTVEHLANLFVRREELDDDVCEIAMKYNNEFREEVESWRSTNEPINKREDGYDFHHMHLNINGTINRKIGIYMPKELHRSIYHNSRTQKGMKKINKAALLWLCEQDTI